MNPFGCTDVQFAMRYDSLQRITTAAGSVMQHLMVRTKKLMFS
jgi:hypothetical protein